MATTYQTIPTEPTTAPEKSRKGVFFGVAAAAFVLGVAAVSTASKPTASIAFSNGAPIPYLVQCPKSEAPGDWWPVCDARYDCDDVQGLASNHCNCDGAWQACEAMAVQRQRPDWWGTCDWIESNSNTDGEQEVFHIDGTNPSTPLECIALVKEQYPDATIANTNGVTCWAQYGSTPTKDENQWNWKSCVLASIHEPQDLKSFQFVDADDTLYKAVNFWIYFRESAEKVYGHISNWDTSLVTNMKELFADNNDFNDDISAWDTANVKNMTSMFDGASSFNQPIGKWDVSNVIKMDMMFYSASAFNQDLSGWNVGNVNDITIMFDDASAFDQDLGWCMQSDVQMSDKWNDYTPFDGTPCFDARCGVHVKGVDC